jgi:NAD(P)-dependent dehydrogenase (short-subunit alcohol dehydrogenase family)
METNNPSKLAVITGAGHRLGRCFAISLAKNGYAILLHYHSSESQALETAAEIRSIGKVAYLHQANLSDCTDIFKMWKFIDTLPHIVDVLINSAATMSHDDIRSVSPKEFDESMAINLRAPLVCSQEAGKRMSNGGLINISDIGAGKNWLGYPIYTISKAGLEVLTRIMAKALAPKIRVNAIAPGLILPPLDMNSDSWDKLIQKVPLKRSALPEEIASMVEYLIKNQYITGQVIDIDGGYSL